ncbi:MAG: hypothetical protein LBF16_01565 [Pseudomonadales bacterium]|jgi:hypothetical protein|nr:hypothetical protein [Pseudomonadales bacterium]
MTTIATLAFTSLIAASALTFHANAQAQGRNAQDRMVNPLFDTPLRQQTLFIPANTQEHSAGALICFYYPHLMLKEASYDDHKGAGLLSTTYFLKEADAPVCQFDRSNNEREVNNWGGFFLGVKGPYIVFEGDDGDGNGMPFSVYTTQGARILTDSGVLHSVDLSAPVRDPDLRPWYENPLVLRYRRSYLAPCSLREDATSCWNTIARVTGLTQAAPPDCQATYTDEDKIAPSYIDYDVEATLDERGIIHLAPLGPVENCYPAP